MPYRTLWIRSLRVGTEDLDPATLNLRRDDPMPGVQGLKSWGITGELDRAGTLPEDAQVVAILDDGREVRGRVLLTGHRMDGYLIAWTAIAEW